MNLEMINKRTVTLILQETEKETPEEIAPHIYTQLKRKNCSKKQENSAESKEIDSDVHH